MQTKEIYKCQPASQVRRHIKTSERALFQVNYFAEIENIDIPLSRQEVWHRGRVLFVAGRGPVTTHLKMWWKKEAKSPCNFIRHTWSPQQLIVAFK